MPRRIQTLCLILTATSVGQQRQPADTPESVFRVTTGLVQADVAVFDRQGRFVDNLQREQFELRVDGAPQAISFFDRVQIGAASGDAPLDGGRTVLFFVDDFHIAYASLKRTRDLLTDFIDNGMGLNDQAAIASSSGQIGFLQQLTSYKAVLRAAVGRLGNRMQQAADMERPSMTAHQADILDKKSDRQLFEYFVKETMRQNPGVPREVADSIVAGRALRMAAESARTTLNTLGALEGLVRSGAELPQRKLVFFISDGFESHLGGSEISNRLERIADSATRSRAAIYTIDARGLTTLPGFDLTREPALDSSGAVDRADAGQLNATQDALYRLAADTGGRAFVDSNALASAIPRALRETSTYYLLAWRPEQQNGRFHRIELGVRDRPDLTVRVPRGYYDVSPAGASTHKKRQSGASGESEALISALQAAQVVTGIPASLSLSYVDNPKAGMVLTVSTHLNAARLDFGEARQAVVDVADAVFNDQGQSVSTVNQRLTILPAKDKMGRRVTYSHLFRLKPGLYQVRTAARDNKTGTVGSAMEWIEIPNLSGGVLAMSSLILGDRATGGGQGDAGTEASNAPMVVRADRSFGSARRLRFLTYIYNAARSAATPDVMLEVQVFRNAKPLFAKHSTRLRTEGIADLSRIPYFGELNLEGMPSGSYVLQVTAIDGAAYTNASQRMSLEIE